MEKVLADHKVYLERYITESKNLISKIKFCQDHKFKEEERIMWVKYNAISMIISDYKELIEQLEKHLAK